MLTPEKIGRKAMAGNRKNTSSSVRGIFVILAASGAFFLLAGVWCSTEVWAGSVVAWGNNEYGQVDPPDGNDFIAIAAGGNCSFALKPDGSIVGWGRNPDGYGEADPPEGNDFVDIDGGGLHSLALRSDGSVIGWGYNKWGQASSRYGHDVVAIGAGGQFSLALKSDGSVIGWGRNMYGQADPPDGKDFVAIAAGGLYIEISDRIDFTIDIYRELLESIKVKETDCPDYS